MHVEREAIVSLFIALVAVIVIIGGFASFTGLAVHSEDLKIDFSRTDFESGAVFDAVLTIAPVTMLAEESVVIYVDESFGSVIAIKKYLDDNSIPYGLEYQNAGSNNIQMITLESPLKIPLADFVSLQGLEPGTHSIKISLSEGDATVQKSFVIIS